MLVMAIQAGHKPGARRRYSGVGEIRTHGTVTRSAVFKTAALNRSATTPVSPNFLPRKLLRKPAHLVDHSAKRACGKNVGN